MDLSQSCSQYLEQSVPKEFSNQIQDNSASIDFELIEKVQNRRYLYDTEDLKHNNKHVVRTAWTETATELGRGVDDVECKKKWKSSCDYYRKRRSLNKGKSGQE
ncbi:unnamed protein product, partial [Allacma fusca]